MLRNLKFDNPIHIGQHTEISIKFFDNPNRF